MSFLEKVKTSRNTELLYLVRGKNNGEKCWFYILVDKLKMPMFLVNAKSPRIDLTKYGKILDSGWGQNPSAEAEKKIMEDYS